MELIIAEKPSVARDLARVLGLSPVGRGSFEGNGRAITWCVGHLVELDEPAAYDGRWKAWRLDTLPMLPREFKLRPSKHGADQLRIVTALLRDRRFDAVVNACDAGREGELIFRYVMQYSGCTLPARRLWISSLTDEAIRRGFAQLRPSAEFDALADAARSRSEADWLVGLNATRALTTKLRASGGDTLCSIGRVQTPTLAMLVSRENAIAAFAPRDYWEVHARFVVASKGGQKVDRFAARFVYRRATQLGSAALAEAIVARATAHCRADDPLGPLVERIKATTSHEPPPMLFDLTSLQRTANRRFGWSAQHTLDVAQTLYERRKILTYPRTDSRHLTSDVAKELPALFAALGHIQEYAPFAARLTEHPPKPNRRIVDDRKVSDHHAIIPTGKVVRLENLEGDERRLFDLVARRFLGVFFPDAEFALTDALIRIGGPGTPPEEVAPPSAPISDTTEPDPRALYSGALPPPPDWFVARGRVRVSAGWQAVAGIGHADDERDADAPDLLPPLAEGQRLDGELTSERKKTQPPRRHTEASLLSAMESAGRALTDDDLRRAMKDTGLGTPATRAAIIETLLRRDYVRRDKKALLPTAMGMSLIGTLPVQSLASPELTGEWEARLARIARGQEQRQPFMADIATYVSEAVSAIRTADPSRLSVARPAPKAAKTATEMKAPKAKKANKQRQPHLRALSVIADLLCPRCRLGHLLVGKRGWGCSRWREGCAFVVWFETAGRRLSDAQLRDLITKGKTRRANFSPKAGGTVEGQLILDVNGEGGARFVAG